MYHFGYKPCVSEVTITKEEEAVPYPPRVGNLRPQSPRFESSEHFFRSHDEASLIS